MSSGSLDYAAFDVKGPRGSGSVLIDRPDKRMMRIRYLTPVLILFVGAIIYAMPIGDLKIVFLPLTWLFAMAVVYSVTMHEILARAVYTVTTEYIESESGIVGKSVRTIPISYIRDVTYGQNPIQSVLGLSDITVSATNGDKIVLKDVAHGKAKRDIISQLLLSQASGNQRKS